MTTMHMRNGRDPVSFDRLCSVTRQSISPPVGPPPLESRKRMRSVTKLPEPEGLLAIVTAAVAAMTWLQPSDRGMVALALEYARRIDVATDEKTVGWLGPHLANTLRSLGGAPAERKALGVEEQVRGKLAELRAGRKK